MSTLIIPKEHPFIYGFVNGIDPQSGVMMGTAVTQDGEVLGSELAFDEYTLAHRFVKHKAKFKQKYPNGYTFEWVRKENIRHHTGLCDAIDNANAMAHTDPVVQ